MAIAEADPPRRRFSLLPRRKYERRPRLKLDRRARNVLSRESRWRRRRSPWPKLLMALAVAGAGWGAWTLWRPAPVPEAAPLAYPQFVAQVEAAFPEALSGHTRAVPGAMPDGRAGPVGARLMLPAHALDSPAASADALDRLAAPFVGKERTISGLEMGARIEALAGTALPAATERCYTYRLDAPRRVAAGDGMVRARPLEIAFNPGC